MEKEFYGFPLMGMNGGRRMKITEIERTPHLTTQDYLANRFIDIYHISSFFKYDFELRKFIQKEKRSELESLEIKINNGFQYFIKGFLEAEHIISLEIEEGEE